MAYRTPLFDAICRLRTSPDSMVGKVYSFPLSHLAEAGHFFSLLFLLLVQYLVLFHIACLFFLSERFGFILSQVRHPLCDRGGIPWGNR